MDYPLITEIELITNSCFEDCHNDYFHNFLFECIYDIKHAKITDKGIIKLTISCWSMNLHNSNKEKKVAR